MNGSILLLAKEFEPHDTVTEHCKACFDALGTTSDVKAIAADSSIQDNDLVSVHTTDVPFKATNVFDWSMMANNEFKRVAKDEVDPDSLQIVHANDWLTVPAGISIAKRYDASLIVTLHSTENNRGFNGQHAPLISDMEWQGCYEADRVIVFRDEVWNSVLFDLDVPEEKIVYIDSKTDAESIQTAYQECGDVA